jgi:hypothetical protein
MRRKKEAKGALPSLEHDKKAIQGLWLLSEPPQARDPMVIRFHNGLIAVCEFLHSFVVECCLHYDLEERGEGRVLLLQGNRLHTCKLDGDALELEGDLFEVSGSGTFLLAGKYHRIQ